MQANSTLSIWTPVCERAHACAGVRYEGGGGVVACRTWVVCFVSKMSIWLARLSHMISLNTRGSAVHLGAAFPPPTERTPGRGRRSFPFSSFTVRFLDRRYPQMAATRVQRFGCSQTTDLTTKQRSVSRLYADAPKNPARPEKLWTRASIHAQPGGRPTSPRKPLPKYPGLP